MLIFVQPMGLIMQFIQFCYQIPYKIFHDYQINSPAFQVNGNLVCNRIPIGDNWMPHIHPKNCPFPSGNHQTRLLPSSLDSADLPPQTASRSNQLFFYNTPDTHTHTLTHSPTEGIGNITYTSTHLRLIDYSDASKNQHLCLEFAQKIYFCCVKVVAFTTARN